jgi:DHA1 family multidrug resistance protein-like MFS transporter
VQQPTSWQRNLWIMVAIQTFSVGSFFLALPFIPLMVQQLGVHDPAQIDIWSGIIYSINALTGALFAPFWGNVADRVGRKRMVVRSSIFGGLTAAMMALAPNVWLVTTARALMGVAAGFSSAAAALVGSLVPETSLGFALGWMATGQLVGTLVGPLIGGAFCDAVHDYRMVFFLTTLGTWICAVLVARLIHEDFTRPPAPVGRRPSIVRQFADIVGHPAMLPMFAVLMLGQITIHAPQPITALYVQEMIGNAPLLATYVGASFAVMGVSDLLASPFLGKRSDELGYRRVLLISLAGAAAFTIPQGFVGNYWVFLALRFGVGAFLGGIIPTATAAIARGYPAEQRGLVYGVSYSAAFMGQFLGPTIGGVLAARFGIAAVFVITGALMLALLAWVARSVRPSYAGGT